MPTTAQPGPLEQRLEQLAEENQRLRQMLAQRDEPYPEQLLPAAGATELNQAGRKTAARDRPAFWDGVRTYLRSGSTKSRYPPGTRAAEAFIAGYQAAAVAIVTHGKGKLAWPL